MIWYFAISRPYGVNTKSDADALVVSGREDDVAAWVAADPQHRERVTSRATVMDMGGLGAAGLIWREGEVVPREMVQFASKIMDQLMFDPACVVAE